METYGSEKITSYDMYELFQKSYSRTSSLQKANKSLAELEFGQFISNFTQTKTSSC